MGGSLSRIWSLLWSKKEIRILILGLVRGVPLRPATRGRQDLIRMTRTLINIWGIQDNAGKTTLLYRLKVRHHKSCGSVLRRVESFEIRGANTSRPQIGEVVTTIPTIGFNVESVTYKNLNLNVWVCAPDLCSSLCHF